MSITKYRNLTTDEFLRELENRDGYSELILECKLRIMNSNSTCPICDGDINKYIKDYQLEE